jgi:hypothetical protein
LVVAVIAIAADGIRRRPRRFLVPVALTVLPIVLFVILRTNLAAEQFNDPLATKHSSEIERGFVASPDDLTEGTVLEPLGRLLPYSWLFVPFWFLYWGIQYTLYLLLGSAYLPLVFLDQRAREQATTRRFLFPLLVASIFLILVAANHNLAGRQGEQFVRGRYVEPLIPLWLALSMGGAIRSGSRRMSWLKVVPFAFIGIIGITSAQNRAADLLYPLRVLFMGLRPDTRLCAGILFGILFAFVVRWWLEVVRRRQWLALAILAFVISTGLASLLRFVRHVEIARKDAVLAHWLADNAPDAHVEVDTGGADTDSLKTTGLAWVVQQIRFFSPTSTLTIAGTGRRALYRLHHGYSDTAACCTHRRSRGIDHVICLSQQAEWPNDS